MDVAAYLGRLGVELGGRGPDQLRALHAAQLYAVPFENLSVHNGEGVSLDSAALFDKIVTRRRGGFCYELNGLFAELLETLGYPVARCAARVWTGDGFTGPLDHLALIVETPQPWLVDVGFGAHALYPLPLRFDVDQPDPGGVFRLVETLPGFVDVFKDGTCEYRLDRTPRPLSDFEMGAWWHSTSPNSHFGRGLLCTLPNRRGRTTISDDLLIETADGVRTERRVSPAAPPALYFERFGIAPDALPVVARV